MSTGVLALEESCHREGPLANARGSAGALTAKADPHFLRSAIALQMNSLTWSLYGFLNVDGQLAWSAYNLLRPSWMALLPPVNASTSFDVVETK